MRTHAHKWFLFPSRHWQLNMIKPEFPSRITIHPYRPNRLSELFLTASYGFFFFSSYQTKKKKKKDRGKKNFKRAEYPVGCKQLSHASGYSSAVIIQSHDGPRRYIPKTAFFWSKREQQHREIPCTADATRRQLRIPRLLGHIYTQRLSCPPV